MAKEFEQPFGVNGTTPGVIFLLKAVGGELDEQDPGLGVVGQEAIEGEVVGDGEDGVGDRDVAGSEAGVALDDLRVDPRHRGGVAKDENVTGAVVDTEDGIVGLDPDAGTVVQKKVGRPERDEQRDRAKREQAKDQAIA